MSAEKETCTLSLVDSRRRLEEARAMAAACNEKYYEVILNIDPDECGIDDRVYAEAKIAECESDAVIAWDKYEKALLRYGWDIVQARKDGIVE